MIQFCGYKAWIDEVRSWEGQVEGGVLRVATLISPTKFTPPLWSMEVRCTCRVKGEVLRCVQACGEAMIGPDFQEDQPAKKLAELVRSSVEDLARQIGCEVREGEFVDDPHRRR